MTTRFGLVGSGYWAREVHAPGLLAHPEVELVGLWGRDRAKTAAAASGLGVRGFDRLENMLAAVDAVAFAVPPQIQTDLAFAAAEAGKHLLLEKPIAVTEAGARRLADAVGRRDLASVVFFTRRFSTEIEDAIQACAREHWYGARVRVHSGAMLPGSPFAESVWRQARGAALWDIGPHVLSILVPVLGPVEHVHALLDPGNVVRLQTYHPAGAEAHVSLSLHAAPAVAGTEYTFEAQGRERSLPEPTFSRPQALTRAAGELVANIVSGERAHRCDVGLGLHVTLSLAAAQRSIETGRIERVAEQTAGEKR